jgi:hypothetical protein
MKLFGQYNHGKLLYCLTIVRHYFLWIKQKISIRILFSGIFFLSIILFISIYPIEVVAPGQGITIIKESDVVIKAPVSAYVKSLYVSQSDMIMSGEALLRYRNIEDEYLLAKTQKILVKDLKREQNILKELCFLYSDIFPNEVIDYATISVDCNYGEVGVSEGGRYVLQFYEDYKQEKSFFLTSSLQSIKRKEELLKKRTILFKKRSALLKAAAGTLRFYDLDVELSDLANQVISYDLIELENRKKMDDKLILFKMKRAERALNLKIEHQKVEDNLLEKNHQLILLTEKKQLSVIHSPISGSVLSMMEGVSVNTFIEKGSNLFVLKKAGTSKEIKAKFNTRYRKYLRVGSKVKIKITAPGINYFFSGVIQDTSSDSLENKKGDASSGRYYEVTILPEQRFIETSLSLGLEVKVFVVSDETTVLDYILSVIPSQIKFEVW